MVRSCLLVSLLSVFSVGCALHGTEPDGSSSNGLDGAGAENAAGGGGTATANDGFVQPTLAPEYATYRSSRRDQLFLYQGDLRNLGATPAEVARVIRPFDVVVLTNVFPVRYVGPNAPPAPGRVDATSGTCTSDGLPSAWSGTELLRAIRRENPEVKIYGYVPSVADLHVAPGAGCTSNLRQHHNFVCPNGTCTDFVRWVDTWHALEAGDPAARLDGIYVDLLNEAYVERSTWANQAAYVHAQHNASGAPYRLLANIAAYNRGGDTRATFWARGVGPEVPHSVSSVAFAAEPMHAEDAIYREGFMLVAGTYEDEAGTIEMLNELVDTYRSRKIRWAVSASELGTTYVPGRHVSFAAWQAAGWIDPGSCYTGPTGESVVNAPRPYSTCSLTLVPPTICGTENHRTTYDSFKQWADGFTSTPGAGGGFAFAFTEARLGLFTGVVPFCANE